MAQEAFAKVMNNVYEATASESAIMQLMLWCVAERDIRVQEIMHEILGLKLHCSFFLSGDSYFK